MGDSIARGMASLALTTKMDAVNENHFFADDTARDAYFVANPTELIAGIFISSGSSYQTYNGSAWVTKTAIVANQKEIKLFTTTPTVDQLADNEVGLILGEIIYPITLRDTTVLDNGFTFRRYGSIASGLETATGVYHLDTLSTPVTTEAAQLEAVATLVKDIASPYVVTFSVEDETVPAFTTEHKGCVCFIYDESVNKEIISPTDHTTYRKLMIQKSYFLDGDIGFAIMYWDSSNGIHYWDASSSTWKTTSQTIAKGANVKLGVSITRNADNSYAIALTNATTSAAITTATTGTDLRNGANTTDRVFIGDHITAVGSTYYNNQDISVEDVVVA